jgi:hypothetical protein
MPLEYRSETIGQVDAGSTTIDDATLNDLAAAGWQLKAVVAGQHFHHPNHGPLPGSVVGIFEREKGSGT